MSESWTASNFFVAIQVLLLVCDLSDNSPTAQLVLFRAPVVFDFVSAVG